jgi:23S rRNA (uracil1939-C5)-methyltransferase
MARRGPRLVEVTVDALSADGLGEASFELDSGERRPVRARNALPGETVTVRVLKRRGGAWFGEAVTPDAAAPSRQVPPCEVFPRCGGCALQHLDYPAQLAHKSARLRAELERAGVRPARLRDPVSCGQFHYRYKARLGVRVVGGELLVGFRESYSSRVARMSDCKTLAPPFVRMLPQLRDALAGLSRPDRVPQVELAGGDREFAVIVRHLCELDGADRARLRDFGRITGMRVFLQSGGYDSVVELDPASTPFLSYANPDFGLCYRFLPTDFTQVNPLVNRALVRTAILALAPEPGARATDLFCGIGNFSLALARRGLDVRGYESAAGAVERARLNARANGLTPRAEFAVADLYDAECPDLPESEYLLLDPPRSGAGPNLARWARSPALQRIAYVSCNPVTFAADAAVLQAQGFVLEQAGIFDMFPHTAHVETLGLFGRADARGAAARG